MPPATEMGAEDKGGVEAPEVTTLEQALEQLKSLSAEMESARRRIKELNAESAKHRKGATDAEAKILELKRKDDEEQGRYKELYEKELAKTATLEATVADEQRKAQVAQIAQKYALPATLASRLKGDTAEELEADAKELAKLLPKRSANPDAGGGAPTEKTRDQKIAEQLALRQKIGF